MSSNYYDTYDGSKLFQPIAEWIGLPIDLVNFLVAQVAALCLARLFRKSLRPASPQFRHAFCLVLGLLMGYFCFGKQAIHMAVLPMASYVVLRVTKADVMGNVVLAVSMLYLSCLHIHRQIYHSGDYTLDITGPLMVITQRVTSLAYSVQDELAGAPPRGTSAANRVPRPLEYFAYTLAFQTLMCGPVVFYTDYIQFIQGDPVDQLEVKSARGSPSPRRAVALKVLGSVSAALLYLSLNATYSLEKLREQMESPSERWSVVYAVWFAYAATLVVRCKYYHAWLLADAICNNCGMGFNGYDDSGAAKWDKLSNIDILGFELAQNFRSAIASWNKNTNVWLRAVAHARGGAAWRTARVYGLSALWHGFYPGYYLTFATGGLFTLAARKVRRVARPLFLGSRALKLTYDLLSFVTTRIAMTYATVPFVFLYLAPSLAFFGKLYYSLHFIALGAVLLPARGAGDLSGPTSQTSLRESNTEANCSNGDTSHPHNGKLD